MYPNDPSTPPQQPEQPPVPSAEQEPAPQVEPVVPEQPAYAPPVQQAGDAFRQQSADESQQPTFAPQQQQNDQAPAAANPGKGLGIAGFVLAFFLPIVGLPLSIVAFLKSKKANMKNGLALAGIILNSVFLVIGVALIAITVMAFAGVQERANTQTAVTAAHNVVTMAEMYNAENSQYSGDEVVPQYPKAYSDISSMIQDVTLATGHLTSAPAEPSTVEFYACGAQTGNKVGHWDYAAKAVMYAYAGDANADSTDCTLVTQ